MKQAYAQSIEEILEKLQTDERGLSTREVRNRQDIYGPNQLKETGKKPLLFRFLEQLKDPMLVILMVAAAVSAGTSILSKESLTEVAIILAVVFLNAVLGVIQESKAEAAIEALQTMTAATCKVLRDGKQETVPSEMLVPGDVVILEAGDAVPGDGRLIACASLKVEESALTGESIPVDKTTDTLSVNQNQTDIPLGDRINMVYMGSTVVYGRGRMVVTNTGMDTQMGKIAGALAQTGEEQTPLQRKLDELSRILSKLVLGICLFIFAFQLITAREFQLKSLLDTFMVAVSLAVAAIPEGLSTVVTLVLSMGITKMSRRNAVIRRMTAVETLGCTQVICSDKTGTLTQNKMAVVDVTGDSQILPVAMALCSDAYLNEQGQAVGEPTEVALVNFALEQGFSKTRLEQEQPRVGEVPFDSGRKMMTTLHDVGDGVVQYTKGGADVVLARCTTFLDHGMVKPMTAEVLERVMAQNQEMAGRALRVLAAAMRNWETEPENRTAEYLEQDLCLIGLTGMIDPVRPEVKAAIRECCSAGIRPVMITGDHRDTAVAIAKELGIIEDASQAMTGSQLDQLSETELCKAVMQYGVYARVQPEHKTRIVNAWKENGCITAMTGDGVNDAPSIKSADIGIGMGITGTDVTKNVADMVLTDDNFATIVSAVEEGRRIYDNIRKAIQFLLASNMSEVLGVFVSSLLGFRLLNPVHLLFLNLITDSLPALALGMEKREPDSMKRPPRNEKEGIFSRGLGVDVLYQGILVTVITIGSYLIGNYFENGIWFPVVGGISNHGMTMAFLTMSMCEIFHSFNVRSQRKSVFSLKSHNMALWLSMLLSLGVTTAVLEVPALADAFGFTPVGIVEYLMALGLSILVIPVVEIVKFFQRKHMQ